MLISSYRYKERDAAAECIYYLALIGDENAEIKPTKISGLLKGNTSLNPIDAVRKLKTIFMIELKYVQFIQKITPLELIVNSTIDKIIEAVDRLKYKIREDETFRITINKRHSHIDRNELIKAIADTISRRVDLKNPDKTILIEIIGDKSGVSIIEKGDILSIQKMRQKYMRI
ncbi:MAG: THUMP domain-containing protein [Candidatus Helarchaeota archaeon]